MRIYINHQHPGFSALGLASNGTRTVREKANAGASFTPDVKLLSWSMLYTRIDDLSVRLSTTSAWGIAAMQDVKA